MDLVCEHCIEQTPKLRTADNGTLYAKLSSLSFTDFTPSRVTRVSSNPYLQEHFWSSNVHRNSAGERLIASRCVHSKGKYISVDFSGYNSQTTATETLEEDFYSTIKRDQSSCDLITSRSLDIEHCRFTNSYPGTAPSRFLSIDCDMDRPISFALAVGDNPVIFEDFMSTNQKISPSPPPEYEATPPALPPKPARLRDHPISEEITLPTNYLTEVEKDNHHYLLSLSPSDIDIKPQVPFRNHQLSSPSSSASSSPSPPSSRRIITAKQCPSNSPLLEFGKSVPNSTSDYFRSQFTSSLENLIEKNELERQPSSTPYVLHRRRKSDTSLHKCLDHKTRFLHFDGVEYGRYSVSYLGSRDVDCYTSCVNECAKQIMDPKLPIRAIDVLVLVTSDKIRLAPPRTGPLFKSFSVKDIFFVGQCTKNKRLFGITIWKPSTSLPVCHLFRCSDHVLSNAFMESVNQAKQHSDDSTISKMSDDNTTVALLSISLLSTSEHVLSSQSSVEQAARGLLHRYPAIHIGSVKAGKHQTVAEIINKVIAEYRPSQSREVLVWMSLAVVRLVQVLSKKEVIYAQHDTSKICTIGIHSEYRRFVGYTIKEKHKPLTAHILLCNSTGNAASLLTFLRQACQLSYQQRGEDDPFITESEDIDEAFNNSSSSQSFISRLRSLKLQRAQSPSPVPHPPSFQSYIGKSHSTSSILDIPQKRKDLVNIQNPTSSLDFPEEDYARFLVTYIGSANMETPFTSESIIKSLQVFEESGVAAGMAAVPKNTITMHVSALGINLIDKKHQMFINRNYPHKQIVGYSVHPTDPKYFGFSTHRPGFTDQLKVHVFQQSNDTIQLILDAIKFWLH